MECDHAFTWCFQVNAIQTSYQSFRPGSKRVGAYIYEESDPDGEEDETFHVAKASVKPGNRTVRPEDASTYTASEEEEEGFSIDLGKELARRKNSPVSSSYEMQLRKLKQQVQRIKGTRTQSKCRAPDNIHDKENRSRHEDVSQQNGKALSWGINKWKEEAERSLAVGEEMRQL